MFPEWIEILEDEEDDDRDDDVDNCFGNSCDFPPIELSPGELNEKI